MVAAAAVLSTPELLEAILAAVDMRTLLVSASRVSRRWHAVVASSTALQRALFFRPAAAGSQGKTPNPLLRRLFPAWFEDAQGSTTTTPSSGRSRFRELRLYAASRADDASSSNNNNPFLRPSASWRRMLVSQPPCRAVVTCRGRAAGGPSSSGGRAVGWPRVWRPEGGLRMGQLYDATLRHCVEHADAAFAVLWPRGAGAEAYVALVAHLRRVIGLLPVGFEMGLGLAWDRGPDLVLVQMHLDGEDEDGGDDDDARLEDRRFHRFWERCGALALGP